MRHQGSWILVLPGGAKVIVPNGFPGPTKPSPLSDALPEQELKFLCPESLLAKG